MRFLWLIFLAFPLGAESLWLPGAAHAPGAKNTFWQTDLWIVNGEASSQTITLYFLETGMDQSQANLARKGVTVTLPPQGEVAIADVLGSLFNVESSAGAIKIEYPGTLKISSRTYTPNFDTQEGGSFGLYIGVLKESQITSPFHLLAAQSSESFRTNMGFVNTSKTATAQCSLTFYDAQGAVLKQANLAFEPYVHVQFNDLFSYFDIPPQKGVTVKGVCDPATVMGYLTTIDNISQDPVYAGGMP